MSDTDLSHQCHTHRDFCAFRGAGPAAFALLRLYYTADATGFYGTSPKPVVDYQSWLVGAMLQTQLYGHTSALVTAERVVMLVVEGVNGLLEDL